MSLRWNILIVVIATVFTLMNPINGQSELYQKNKFCGKILANTLHFVCNGVYNAMFKKSGQEIEMDDYQYMYEYPLRSRASANAMLGRFDSRFRRQSRGIHDECCLKECTLSELRSYCGN